MWTGPAPFSWFTHEARSCMDSRLRETGCHFTFLPFPNICTNRCHFHRSHFINTLRSVVICWMTNLWETEFWLICMGPNTYLSEIQRHANQFITFMWCVFLDFWLIFSLLLLKKTTVNWKKNKHVFVQTSAWDQISISPSVHENSMVK